MGKCFSLFLRDTSSAYGGGVTSPSSRRLSSAVENHYDDISEDEERSGNVGTTSAASFPLERMNHGEWRGRPRPPPLNFAPVRERMRLQQEEADWSTPPPTYRDSQAARAGQPNPARLIPFLFNTNESTGDEDSSEDESSSEESESRARDEELITSVVGRNTRLSLLGRSVSYLTREIKEREV
jgi:hypothetical protein